MKHSEKNRTWTLLIAAGVAFSIGTALQNIAVGIAVGAGTAVFLWAFIRNKKC